MGTATPPVPTALPEPETQRDVSVAVSAVYLDAELAVRALAHLSDQLDQLRGGVELQFSGHYPNSWTRCEVRAGSSQPGRREGFQPAMALGSSRSRIAGMGTPQNMVFRVRRSSRSRWGGYEYISNPS